MKINLRLTILCILISAFGTCMACAGQDELDSEKLVITESSFTYSQEGPQKIITTLGNIKNLSNTKAEDIVVEVKYYDAGKKLIDVSTEQLYGISVPAGQEVSFRVREEADKSKNQYVTNSVRVVSATGQIFRHDQPKPRSSRWLDILIAWMPMIMLIAVWIYLVKRNSVKGPAARTVELVEQQNQLLERQIGVLERLSNVAEKMNSGK